MLDSAFKSLQPALIFNLSQEPALVYSLSTFADKSDDLLGRTSQKLQDNVLYIETDRDRFEICKQTAKESDNHILKYKFSRVKDPYFKDNAFMAQAKRPLDESILEIVFRELDWSDF
jgi:hypothetical protein